MITYETWCQIRTFSRRKHMTFAQIAVDMHLSARTVAKWAVLPDVIKIPTVVAPEPTVLAHKALGTVIKQRIERGRLGSQSANSGCTFGDPRFNAVSAIWAIDFNGGQAIGNSEPSAVVHNPNATNHVPLGFLPTEAEYLAIQRGDQLLLTKASVPHTTTEHPFG
ncbi:MAG: hypothetical protein IPN53_10815 [Comamonadaceae bacterium]|nr:hypothetical protein [Comamonadaceae bacterium]